MPTPGSRPPPVDALRLSRAMTLKNSAADLDLGGGKAVLLDDGGWQDAGLREARMRALGRRIERLGGDYVTAEDVGTNPTDMAAIGRETRWVAGRPKGDGGRGDPRRRPPAPSSPRSAPGPRSASAGTRSPACGSASSAPATSVRALPGISPGRAPR